MNTTSNTTSVAALPRRRALLLAGVIVVLLAVAAYLWHRQHTTGATTAGAATASGGSMAGMNMSSGGAVQLTANQIRQFGVTFGTADVRPLAVQVRTVGTVTVDETKLAQVAPKFGGYVERLYVDQTGQHVSRGQPLMDVYSPELLAAEQELLVAAGLQRSIGQSGIPGVPAQSTDFLAAARRRLQLWDISDAQIAAILRSGTPRRTLTLYAPASGVVLDKNVVQGQAIQPGQMLYRIADLGDVWIDAQLREADAGAVRTGSRATVTLVAYPGRPFTGHVTYVYPTLDSAARTVTARVTLPNPDGLLKPGMFATVQVTTPTRAALTVPTSAVLQTGTRAVVFVDMGGGRLMPQTVQTGQVAGDLTEILSGLEPGQRVVTSAQFLLDSESNLGEVMKSMIGQTNMSDMKSTGTPGTGTSGTGTSGTGTSVTGGGTMNTKGASTRGMASMPGMAMPDTTPRR